MSHLHYLTQYSQGGAYTQFQVEELAKKIGAAMTVNTDRCRRGIKFHTKQSSNPVCTVLNDTHPEIKIHTNSYYKI